MGFLTDITTEVRAATDEPATDAKYSDARIVELVSKAHAAVWNDINRMSKNKLCVRYDLSVTTDQTVYALPPTLAHIVDVARLDTSGNVVRRYDPSDHLNPAWPGMIFEGSTLYFESAPSSDYTLRIKYMPSGFVALNAGTLATFDTSSFTVNVVTDRVATAGGANDFVAGQAVQFSVDGVGGTLPAGLAVLTTYWIHPVTANAFTVHTSYAGGLDGVTDKVDIGVGWVATVYVAANGIKHGASACYAQLPAVPTTGSLDKRENAYAGTILRILTTEGPGDGIEAERAITAYDPRTRIATIKPPFASDRVPVGVTTYEITPFNAYDLILPLGQYVARLIVSQEGDPARYATINMEYSRLIREVRLRAAHFDEIRGNFFRVATARSPQTIRSPFGRLDRGQVR